jgi:ParB family chromosome partitioning protein
MITISKNHQSAVRDDEEMRTMVESVKDKGVTQPAIVRPREDSGYEIVSGHRRQKASELAGYFEMPCIVRNLTDEEAITQMVEDNTNQRENILPSERAKALKMQLEAIKRQGARADLSTSGQDAPKLETRFIKHRIRTHPARQVRKWEQRNIRAKADFQYRTMVQEHPELKSNPVSRFWQKRRLKKQYAKQA